MLKTDSFSIFSSLHVKKEELKSGSIDLSCERLGAPLSGVLDGAGPETEEAGRMKRDTEEVYLEHRIRHGRFD